MKIREPRMALFFVLLAVLLMANSVPAQQYTAVKSVHTSEPIGSGDFVRFPSSNQQQHPAGSGAISARSIGDSPVVSDSKIIKLSIKSNDPRVASGFRGARNLGFVADASLNAIPGGLNNELDVKVPIIPTTTGSTLARDSYGNVVTPYAELGTTGLDASGFDLNRNPQQAGNRNQIGNLNFKVPSYASGILEPVILPPNPPASFVQQPPVQQQTTTTTTPVPRTTQFQFVANAKIPTVDEANSFFGQVSGGSSAPGSSFQFVPDAKIPTIEDGQILFAQKPINGLVPPRFPGELGPTFNIEVGTERSTIFVKDPFGGASLDSLFSLPNDRPAIDFNNRGSAQPIGPPQLPQQPQLAPPQVQQQPPQIHQQPKQPQGPQQPQIPQQPQLRPTEAPVQKFTGSFGGAPGLLGNQQNLGTAYTTTASPKQPILPQIRPTPPPPPPPPTQFITTPRPAPPTQPAPNKFTGSFGGAPGFLGNQQNLGTAYKPTTPQPQIPQPQPPIPFQPPQQPQQQIPNIIRPPAPFQPPTVQHNPPQQPPRPPPVQQFPGNKFTGSFGGAPGLLGNQKKPGTHVSPDGSILPPSGPGLNAGAVHQNHPAPPQPPHQQPSQQHPHQQQQPRPVSSGSTFTGSFGGPPGILRPFDNVKQG
ncbi:bromodomain-containing protein 4-like [Uranotaenia lowii]|uniref:bromodomain-containing protein 4-like n=1 Tax=Uranotaenia lowii TaxID=190385 RepID=UPI0024791665|nr:bromodomain-containing protein 4-like [Uranotaenia lowii]